MKLSTAYRVTALSLLAASGALLRAAPETSATESATAEWRMQTWKGEHAFVSTAGDWRAVVSTDRARLIYFGPTETEQNLLYAPATRNEPVGWGGHRVWLGPQSQWRRFWPPEVAWETSRPAVVVVEKGHLRLTMPDEGAGWARVVRDYFWQGDHLRCRVEMKGGTRDAQIIQIIQIPDSSRVTVKAFPTDAAPRGYVQVHLGRTPSPQPKFGDLPQVTARPDDWVELRFTGQSEKLAFRPQTLTARVGAYELRLGRTSEAANVKQELDGGFYTQVYLGDGSTSLIELEQLSPLYPASADGFLELDLSAATAK